jgi:UrcA family protein
MVRKTALWSAGTLWAPIAVSALFVGNAVAAGRTVVVSAPVDTSGLDLSRPTDVGRLYRRFQYTARYVCGSSIRVGLAPAEDPKGCYERALANAIRSAKLPMLTQLYLDTHTLQEAAARGMEVPPQVSARN